MNTIALAERQTIERAGELKEDILAALDRPEPIRVDASRVGQIDTSAMQLLAVLWRSAAHCGNPPSLDGPSPEFRRVAGLLGLDGLFGIRGRDAGGNPCD